MLNSYKWVGWVGWDWISERTCYEHRSAVLIIGIGDACSAADIFNGCSSGLLVSIKFR